MSILAVVGFVLGLAMPAAYAQSYKTSPIKVFGHSTSCTLGIGSINDTTHKGGAQTVNRVGCDVNNAPRAVPANRMYAHTSLYRSNTSYMCGEAGKWNSTSTATLTVTASLRVQSVCPANGTYYAVTSHARIADNGASYVEYRQTGAYRFR
ncbi:hypothetical protein AFL01nite_12460 [Aeromicrobium flavum]|uniref:Ig-like domain-containing protein n=1 Tax=Aeromicrobium flavum TaxID=416568 RepID=A0A512HTZ6_9ACTN|nr:hypothetical protein [Aeromicrobium flavum]GEO88919.1 hypothetical protein AFL01nite_12460 [Aeromicrobium flavum]